MPGVFCRRCQTRVLLEQDDKTCSNCGAVLVNPIFQQPAPSPPPPATPRRVHRKRPSSPPDRSAA